MKKKLADEVENIRVEFDEKFRLVEDQKEELAKKLKRWTRKKDFRLAAQSMEAL